MTFILTFMLPGKLRLAALPTHSFATTDQFVTSWLHCSQENNMLFEKGVLDSHLVFPLSSFVSYVRDDGEISPDSVLCVGYHVGYGFCGICERYRRVLW